jgi:prophage regulatory protein
MAVRFVRFKELRQRVGLSRTSIWRLERKGQFPRRRQLSDNAVAWLEDEVDQWVPARDSVTVPQGRAGRASRNL